MEDLADVQALIRAPANTTADGRRTTLSPDAWDLLRDQLEFVQAHRVREREQGSAARQAERDDQHATVRAWLMTIALTAATVAYCAAVARGVLGSGDGGIDGPALIRHFLPLALQAL
jgi:hypothetical protein